MSRSLSRRDLLAGGAALGVTIVAAACQQTPDTKPEVDALQAQIDLAVRDAALAAAAATGNVELAPSLNAIAGIRSAHVAALTSELKRIPGAYANALSTSSTAASSTASVAPAAPPQIGQVKSQLKDSARAAMDLATVSSGYRAGLLASISAACSSAAEVDLP